MSPTSPNVPRDIILGFVSGLVISFCYIVLVDLMSHKVRTLGDLRRIVGERALAAFGHSDFESGDTRIGSPQNGALKELGQRLENRLAARGDFDAGLIQVTGFGSAPFVKRAASVLAAALAFKGSDFVHSNPGSKPSFEGIGVECDLQKEPDPGTSSDDGGTSGTVNMECVGPVSIQFSWRTVSQRSPALICAIPAGRLDEDIIESFCQAADRSGVSRLSFVLFGR